MIFKKITMSGCAFVITIFATTALAANYGNIPTWKQRFYLQLGGGVSWQFSSNWEHAYNPDRNVDPDQTTRPGYLTSFGAGYALQKIPLRLSLNYLYFSQIRYHWMDATTGSHDDQHDTGKVNVQAGLFDVTYDFINRTRWTPFVKAGIGFAHIATHFIWTDPNASGGSQNNMNTGWHSNNKFTWEVATGVNYRLNPSWLVGVSATYLDLGTVQFYEYRPTIDSSWIYFNAVKLKNLSLMANITWRPMANNNGLNAIMIPASGFHAPSANIWKRFYLQGGGGPAWQLSNNWASISGVAAIRSPQDMTRSNMQGALAIGYAMQKWPLRFDLTYLYITQTDYDWEYLYKEEQSASPYPDSYYQGYAHVDTQAGLFDITYDFVNHTRWTPFISAGAGIAHISSQFSRIILGSGAGRSWTTASWHSKNNFVWQVASGVNYTLTSHWLMGIKANYIDLGKNTFYYLNNGQEQKHQTGSLINFGAMIDIIYRF